jgi:23S rRNA (pseudouridine1915-N3)-methyltransferase
MLSESSFSLRIHLVWAGKTRERHCAALIDDYLSRIQRFSPLELTEVREAKGAGSDDQARKIESDRLIEAVSSDDYVVLLDEQGEERTSVQFSRFIAERQQAAVKKLAFIIGPHSGASDELRNSARATISLSALTLTHELARVILVEQIYRAFTMLAGTPYHRY